MALARMPPLNHSWGIALQVTPRGLSTRPMPCGDRTFAIEFDFVDHRLAICTSDGTSRSLPLAPRSVASFYADIMHTLDEMGLPVRIWRMPVEIPDPVPFDEDTMHASQPVHARELWRIFVASERTFTSARARFVGKCSPVHFFWGGFDLAVTRFSGRRAPPREGPAFMREGMLARGDQPRLLAGQRTDAVAGVLRMRRFPRRQDSTRSPSSLRPLLSPGARGVHPAV